MRCEVCGKPIFKTPVVVEIEGTKMRTCATCSKFGTVVIQPGKQTGQRPPVLRFKKRTAPREIVVPEPKEDYNVIIKSAREKRGLTREELGKKINEKISVITRLESKKMRPDIKLAKKLERALKIKILDDQKADDTIDAPHTITNGMTIGDMIKTKKK